MTQLPVQRETIDMATGKVIATDTAHFTILPPPADTCQECGVKHDPAQPHNAQSLHYQYSFYARNGRWPTWVDAMEPCTEAVREAWTKELTARGVDVAGGQVNPSVGAS